MVQNGALPGALLIKGFQLKTSGSGVSAIWGSSACNITPGNLDFGSCVTSHIFMQSGAYYNYTNDNTISGGTQRHVQANAGGIILNTGNLATTTTLNGTPAFQRFAFAQFGGLILLANQTFVGGATGVRYLAQLNGIINTASGSGTYFPGDSAGSTATGGQYT